MQTNNVSHGEGVAVCHLSHGCGKKGRHTAWSHKILYPPYHHRFCSKHCEMVAKLLEEHVCREEHGHECRDDPVFHDPLVKGMERVGRRVNQGFS